MDLATARRYARRLPNLVSDTDYFPFIGGLNLVDTPLTLKPGQAIASKNYEVLMRGGYERIEGFERYDGREAPSEAHYWILDFTAPTSYPVTGAAITGDSSGASGVLIDSTATSGRIVLRSVTGVFIDGEPLRADGVLFAIADGTATLNDAETDELDAQYSRAVRDYARSMIQAVPGEGAVLGVVTYRGTPYAIRNNVGSTAAVMHKATTAGWVPVTLGRRLNFDAGVTQPTIGTTITGDTSNATGVLQRIVVKDGDWLTHDAAGYLILTSVTDAFQDNETISGGGGSMTADGVDAAQSLPAGGRYDFRIHNFYGSENTRRLYAVNGVGKAFEYQDSPEFLCLIDSGMPDDRPVHLAIHKNQLWLAFRGGSIQKSGTGEPSDWTAITNSFELALGDDPTGFLEEIGGALFAFCRNQTNVITGNEADGYARDTFAPETGAYRWTIQRLGQGFYLDDRGFTTLAAAQDFGNFSANNVSVQIDPLVHELKNSVTASVASKTKNRIRYFFEDGRMISVGFIGKKIGGFMECNYGKTIRCAHSEEDPDGNEILLMGDDAGFVYRADSGLSFDGESIQCFLRLAFHHSGAPSRIKRYRLAHVDVATKGPTSLRATVDYSYANPDASFEPVKDLTLRGGGGFWDISKWNEFRWSAGVQAQATFKLEGSGYNIGLLFSSEADDELPHTLNGVTFHVSGRRLNRST